MLQYYKSNCKTEQRISNNKISYCNEVYVPNQPAIQRKTLKKKMAYDNSTKSETHFSLNDCLEKGTPLQNKL